MSPCIPGSSQTALHFLRLPEDVGVSDRGSYAGSPLTGDFNVT